jgi:hypothetical protein
MYVTAIHDITDPDKFWSTVSSAQIPDGFALHVSLPNTEGNRCVCLWEGESVDAVRNLVEGTVGSFSQNAYYEVKTDFAMGLPG